MKRTVVQRGGIALTVAALFTLGTAIPQGDEQQEATFAPAAEAKERVTEAVHLAAKKNRRVLVVWGSDTRASDVEFHDTVRRGKTEAWPFYYEYVMTPLDCGEANAALAKSLGAPAKPGAPVLTILDANGEPLAHRAASEFLSGDGTDVDKVGAFLSEHKTEARDAEKVLKGALAEAKQENKRLFVHLGAPW